MRHPQRTAPKPEPTPATPTPELLLQPETATPTPATPTGKAPKAPKPETACHCGCGLTARRRFRQGHDARLKGILQRAHAGCAHPDDTPLATIAIAMRAGGLTPATESAWDLAIAENPAWGDQFLASWKRPGTRKATAAA